MSSLSISFSSLSEPGGNLSDDWSVPIAKYNHLGDGMHRDEENRRVSFVTTHSSNIVEEVLQSSSDSLAETPLARAVFRSASSGLDAFRIPNLPPNRSTQDHEINYLIKTHQGQTHTNAVHDYSDTESELTSHSDISEEAEFHRTQDLHAQRELQDLQISHLNYCMSQEEYNAKPRHVVIRGGVEIFSPPRTIIFHDLDATTFKDEKKIKTMWDRDEDGKLPSNFGKNLPRTFGIDGLLKLSHVECQVELPGDIAMGIASPDDLFIAVNQGGFKSILKLPPQLSKRQLQILECYLISEPYESYEPEPVILEIVDDHTKEIMESQMEARMPGGISPGGMMGGRSPGGRPTAISRRQSRAVPNTPGSRNRRMTAVSGMGADGLPRRMSMIGGDPSHRRMSIIDPSNRRMSMIGGDPNRRMSMIGGDPNRRMSMANRQISIVASPSIDPARARRMSMHSAPMSRNQSIANSPEANQARVRRLSIAVAQLSMPPPIIGVPMSLSTGMRRKMSLHGSSRAHSSAHSSSRSRTISLTTGGEEMERSGRRPNERELTLARQLTPLTERGETMTESVEMSRSTEPTPRKHRTTTESSLAMPVAEAQKRRRRRRKPKEEES